MKMSKKVVAVLALVALLVGAGVAVAQVTSLSTDFYGRLHGNGPVVVLSSCGTAPTVVGTDSAGVITIGTGTPSACTVTFARAYVNAPACFFVNQTTITSTPGKVATTTTTALWTLGAATANGDKVSYMCVGY